MWEATLYPSNGLDESIKEVYVSRTEALKHTNFSLCYIPWQTLMERNFSTYRFYNPQVNLWSK